MIKKSKSKIEGDSAKEKARLELLKRYGKDMPKIVGELKEAPATDTLPKVASQAKDSIGIPKLAKASPDRTKRGNTDTPPPKAPGKSVQVREFIQTPDGGLHELRFERKLDSDDMRIWDKFKKTIPADHRNDD